MHPIGIIVGIAVTGGILAIGALRAFAEAKRERQKRLERRLMDLKARHQELAFQTVAGYFSLDQAELMAGYADCRRG